MAERDADIAVIGAGVVGLATAHALARSRPDATVLVIEANQGPGRETSSHNTGIVHAGMFYETGSLKHRFCLRGNVLLHEWADRTGVPLLRCGKLIVAPDDDALPGLDRVEARATANDVREMRRLDAGAAREIEPHVRAVAALWSGTSAVIDQAAYARSLDSACRDAGALVVYQHTVTEASRESEDFVLSLQDADGQPSTLRVGALVNAAGHGAPSLAAALGYPLDGSDGVPVLAQRKNRGVYYDFLVPSLARAVSRPIYPVPPQSDDVQRHQARAGGLGIHLSVDVDGIAHVGPDTTWVEGGARPARDLDYSAVDEDRAPFVAAVRRILDLEVDASDLTPGQVGYRPKIAHTGDVPGDFVIFQDRGYLHLGGIESPGLTSSLAIGEYVAEALT